jgi:hypothetical protein
MKQQAEIEIHIFKKFARLYPHPIRLNSITKKEPPEPDISCNLTNGSTMAFELVECIDNSMAQSFYSSLKLKKTFDDGLKKLSQAIKERFKESFRNALIFVAFNKEISDVKKMVSIPTILDYLLTLKATAEGKFNFGFHQDLRDVVRYILISRGIVGPIFDVEGGGFFADPCRERIQDKFEKTYEIKSKTELLAYYELQPELRESFWLPSVQEFVENNIEKSVFQRVWVYSVTKNKIIFFHPVF